MSAVISLDQYPVRPLPREGESLSGYCLRIYMLNGHTPFTGIVGDSRVTAHALLPAHRLLLNALLGRKPAETQFLREHRLLFGEGESRLAWRDAAIGQRFCPACMKAFGFHCVLWNLPFVTACPLHGCRLLEHCTACSERLNWGALYGFSCNCGVAVAAMACKQASDLDIRLSRIVAACDEFEGLSRAVGLAPLRGGWPRCTVDDLYSGINWALYARNLLHRARRQDILAAPPTHKARTTDRSPGRDVLQFIAGLPLTARRAVRLLLRSAQIGGTSVLVNPRSDIVLRQLDLSLLARGQGQNRFARWLASTVRSAIARDAVPLPRTAMAMYRPSLNAAERLSLHTRLQAWWVALMGCLTVAERRAQLPKLYQLTLHTEWGLEGFSGNVVRTINLLFDIVKAGIPAERFEAVIARWQISESMRAGRGDLADIAGVIASMNAVEHAFLYELLLHDVVASLPEDASYPIWASAVCP